jgi:hypothetical protein
MRLHLESLFKLGLVAVLGHKIRVILAADLLMVPAVVAALITIGGLRYLLWVQQKPSPLVLVALQLLPRGELLLLVL